MYNQPSTIDIKTDSLANARESDIGHPKTPFSSPHTDLSFGGIKLEISLSTLASVQESHVEEALELYLGSTKKMPILTRPPSLAPTSDTHMNDLELSGSNQAILTLQCKVV